MKINTLVLLRIDLERMLFFVIGPVSVVWFPRVVVVPVVPVVVVPVVIVPVVPVVPDDDDEAVPHTLSTRRVPSPSLIVSQS